MANIEFDLSDDASVIKGVTSCIKLAATKPEHLATVIAKLVTQCLAAKRRLDDLEKSLPNLKYVGSYETGREYQRGNFVTDNGSTWHCDKATKTRPGDGDCWTLAVKRGRDAR